MADRRPVEMVRIEQPEEVYEVEAVFGRDAASVFPSMKEEHDPLAALKATMGAKRFVTETELEAIKAARGLTVDDGTAAADKSLAEVLAAAKQAKQDAFDEQWRQMKTGKNRPLDPDEMEFLEHLHRREADADARVAVMEAQELAGFREAVAAAAAAKAAAAAGGGGAGDGDGEAAGTADAPGGAAEAGPSSLGSRGASQPAGAGSAAAAGRRQPGLAAGSKPGAASSMLLKPVLKVKPKAANTGGSSGGPDAKRQRLDGGQGSSAAAPQHKPEQQQQQKPEEQPQAEGLAGLLGGYASDSSE